MHALIPFDWQDILHQCLDWLERYVLVPAFLAQMVCLGALLLLMRLTAPVLRRLLLQAAGKLVGGPLHTISIALVHVALRDALRRQSRQAAAPGLRSASGSKLWRQFWSR